MNEKRVEYLKQKIVVCGLQCVRLRRFGLYIEEERGAIVRLSGSDVESYGRVFRDKLDDACEALLLELGTLESEEPPTTEEKTDDDEEAPY